MRISDCRDLTPAGLDESAAERLGDESRLCCVHRRAAAASAEMHSGKKGGENNVWARGVGRGRAVASGQGEKERRRRGRGNLET